MNLRDTPPTERGASTPLGEEVVAVDRLPRVELVRTLLDELPRTREGELSSVPHFEEAERLLEQCREVGEKVSMADSSGRKAVDASLVGR